MVKTVAPAIMWPLVVTDSPSLYMSPLHPGQEEVDDDTIIDNDHNDDNNNDDDVKIVVE